MRLALVKMDRRLLRHGVLCMAVAVASMPMRAAAQPLETLLPELLQKHERITAAQHDLEKSRHDSRRALGDYLPSVDLTLGAGTERTRRLDNPTTDYSIKDNSISLRQLIWDFGKTTADIRAADIGVQRAEAALKNAQQALTLEAVTTYFSLLRAVETLQYAQQSEASIKKQTGLEEYRVKRGGGVATDVLQAQTQLAGAVANRVRAEGSLTNAINRFRAVFRREPGELATFKRPQLPHAKLPKNLDEAVQLTLENNIDLAVANYSLQAAKESMNADRARVFGPRIDFTAKYNDKDDTAAVVGYRKETLAKVELTFPLFAGFKNQATSDASTSSFMAQNDRYIDQRIGAENAVRDSWQNVITQQTNAYFLRNQSEAAGEFLDLARKERQLGRRSLIDVLSGETSYISAVSTAVSAETDYALAIYALLASMGKLDLVAVLGEGARPKP